MQMEITKATETNNRAAFTLEAEGVSVRIEAEGEAGGKAILALLAAAGLPPLPAPSASDFIGREVRLELRRVPEACAIGR